MRRTVIVDSCKYGKKYFSAQQIDWQRFYQYLLIRVDAEIDEQSSNEFLFPLRKLIILRLFLLNSSFNFLSLRIFLSDPSFLIFRHNLQD